MNKVICCCAALGIVATLFLGCASPARIEITPDNVVFERAGDSMMLQATVFDQDDRQMSHKGIDLEWMCKDNNVVRLTSDGEVAAVASGDAKVEVTIPGVDLRAETSVRVKLPSSIRVSQDKLRLWEGETKEDVWAEVLSEKGAFLEGYLPEWSSDDPSIVKVEKIVDPNRRQSWVKLIGVRKGTSQVSAKFRGISGTIRVAVFAEDEEVVLAGDHISEKKLKDAKREAARKKKNKPTRIAF
jgi:hypothetical protein